MEFKIAILISGNGSNMLNIIKASQGGEIKSKIVTVISNKINVLGIKKAKEKQSIFSDSEARIKESEDRLDECGNSDRHASNRGLLLRPSKADSPI